VLWSGGMIDTISLVNDNDLTRMLDPLIGHAVFGDLRILTRKVYTDSECEIYLDDRNNRINTVNHIKKLLTASVMIREISYFPKDEDDERCRETAGVSAKAFDSSDNSSKTDQTSRINICFDQPLQFKLKLEPVTGRVFEDFSVNDKEVECLVIWNGRFFLAYSSNYDDPGSLFGTRVRHTIEAIFSESDLLIVDSIGPSPYHYNLKAIYVLGSKITKINPEAKLTPALSGRFILIPCVITKEESITDQSKTRGMLYCFNALDYVFESFYCAEITRCLLLLKNIEIANRFTKLNDDLVNLLGTGFNLVKRHQLLNKLSESSILLNSMIAEYHDIKTELDNWHQAIKHQAGSLNDLKAVLRDQLIQDSQADFDFDRECINRTLTQVSEESSKYSSLNAQLISALLGALIGAGLTWAVTTLLGK
jgi:hypothetical protein